MFGVRLRSDTIVGWATLSHPHTQLACERQGLALVGMLPTERWVDAQGITRLVCEALYAVSLVPDAQRLDAGVRGRAGPLRRVVAASASFGECFEAPLELDVSTSRHGTAVRFVGAREPLAIVVERSAKQTDTS